MEPLRRENASASIFPVFRQLFITFSLSIKQNDLAIKKAGFREVEFCICLGRVVKRDYLLVRVVLFEVVVARREALKLEVNQGRSLGIISYRI